MFLKRDKWKYIYAFIDKFIYFLERMRRNL